MSRSNRTHILVIQPLLMKRGPQCIIYESELQNFKFYSRQRNHRITIRLTGIGCKYIHVALAKVKGHLFRSVMPPVSNPSEGDPRYDRDFQRLESFSRSLKQKLRISVAELAFILSFALNFAIGKLLHLYSDQSEVYNYYNDKNNLFNQYFVKKGWAWTTMVIIFFYAVVVLRRKNEPSQRVLITAIARYFAATLWWALFTQWCFGLPIMDRVFVYTGGKCVVPDGKHWAHLFEEIDGMFHSQKVSSFACRSLRGSWEGGHDPLGHVFLLVHSSLYLFFEIKPYWRGWSQFRRNIERLRGPNFPAKLVDTLNTTPQIAAVMLMALWWFMLLMTNMYFHLIAEKLVGLLFGYAAIGVVYILPRWL